MFPALFSILGKMEGEYNIILKPGAQPFSISTLCTFPSLSYQTVEEELLYIACSNKELSPRWKSQRTGVHTW